MRVIPTPDVKAVGSRFKFGVVRPSRGGEVLEVAGTLPGMYAEPPRKPVARPAKPPRPKPTSGRRGK